MHRLLNTLLGSVVTPIAQPARTGPGRKTLYTHHHQIFKTQGYFNARQDRDRRSQREHGAIVDLVWANRVMSTDAPKYLKRWRGLVQKRFGRTQRVKR